MDLRNGKVMNRLSGTWKFAQTIQPWNIPTGEVDSDRCEINYGKEIQKVNAGLSLPVNAFTNCLITLTRAMDRDEFNVPYQTRNEEPVLEASCFD